MIGFVRRLLGTTKPQPRRQCGNCQYFQPDWYRGRPSTSSGRCYGLPPQIAVRSGRSDGSNGEYDSAHPRVLIHEGCSLFERIL